MLNKLRISGKINSLVLGIIILMSIILFFFLQYEISTEVKKSAADKAKSDLQLSYQYINQKFPGEWSIKGNELYKGNVKMNGNFAIVDEIGEMTDDTVTIFQGNTRVATNVIKDGKRAVGTTVSTEVEKEVLDKGNLFVGEANVVGNMYQTAYMPIKGKDGKIIGIWYVGVSQKFVDDTIQSVLVSLTIVLVITIVIAMVISFFFTAFIKKRLRIVTSALKKAGNGDFSITLIDNSNDEIGELAKSYNDMKSDLQVLIHKVHQTTEQIAAASEEWTASLEQTSKAADQITVSIQQVSLGANDQVDNAAASSQIALDISNNVTDVTTQIESLSTISNQAAKTSVDGNQIAKKAVDQMNVIQEKTTDISDVINSLNAKSSEIETIVQLISSIAEQTNLLSLNAAIEAARAGEHGKGFAVVADEVRKLAEQSSEATAQIRELIQEIQNSTLQAVTSMDAGSEAINEGIQYVDQAGEFFNDITQSVNNVAGQLEAVAATMQTMQSGTGQLVGTTEHVLNIAKQASASAQNVSAASEQQNAAMQEIAVASQTLVKMAQELHDAITAFKIE
ncbi:methyl-accepting chemotaxis protein [Calidifontibacillus oryziterrae]|uniref:methyl-accepting chemotaxis protein n=1 Tax=Calidifontibacillus oryziterrae TaxID=1191699 RepID=UPI0002D6F45C|nr:methyl-accepting chemotaxis protein [Calidifontibacillus oryziterrae]